MTGSFASRIRNIPLRASVICPKVTMKYSIYATILLLLSYFFYTSTKTKTHVNLFSNNSNVLNSSGLSNYDSSASTHKPSNPDMISTQTTSTRSITKSDTAGIKHFKVLQVKLNTHYVLHH